MEHTIRTRKGEKRVKLTPLKAARLKCLDCCLEQAQEVRLCLAEVCPFHPFRFGKGGGPVDHAILTRDGTVKVKRLTP